MSYAFHRCLLRNILAANPIRQYLEGYTSEEWDVDWLGCGPHAMTLLCHAAENGHLDNVRVLIEQGADVNHRADRGYTPLHFAGTPEIAELLIQHGADLEAMDGKGDTPLQNVLTDSNPRTGAIVKVLLLAGANTNAYNPRYHHGNMPIQIALGCLDIMGLLLDSGACPTDGLKACMFGAMSNMDVNPTYNACWKAAEYLLRAGGDPFCRGVRSHSLAGKMRVDAYMRELVSCKRWGLAPEMVERVLLTATFWLRPISAVDKCETVKR